MFKPIKALKMIVGGLGAAAFGAWLFVGAFEQQFPAEPPDTSGLWKGPLIFVLGIAVAGFGFMFFNETIDPPSHPDS
jgi:hypothetical protein